MSDLSTGTSANPSLDELIVERYSRRDALRSGASASAMALFGSSMLAACGGGGNDGGSSDNPAPTVKITAGDNVTVTSGTLVTVTATATDNGSVGKTAFTQVSGPFVSLSSANGTSTSFAAPAVTSAATVVIRFTATDDTGKEASADAHITVNPAVLAFTAVAKNRLDVVTVPAGYTVGVLYRGGDPLNTAIPAYRNDGTDGSFAGRAGDHHGAIRFFGVQASGNAPDNQSNARGILAVTHPDITPAYLHPLGPTGMSGTRPEAEALKEIEAHGISFVEVTAGGAGWSYAAGSTFNRRITPNSAIAINGPVRGNAAMQTAFSSGGTDARGTIGASVGGYSAWGTFLTGEESWTGYFRRPPSIDNPRRSAKEVTSLTRYGITLNNDAYRWSSVSPANGADTSYRRWDAQATASAATGDYRNEPNNFGWILESDPYNPGATPRKRTAMGRLCHNGCWPAPFVAGRKPAWYLADGGPNEYLYKFVSATAWDLADASKDDRLAIGDKYLDSGTLYVARFNADGTGTWVPLTFDTGEIKAANTTYAFADQADVLLNARLAGDVSGATRLDRAGWINVREGSSAQEIYVALNGNPLRNAASTNAINPRAYVDPPSASGNANGHILRLAEAGGTGEATSFGWDVYMFGAGADLNPTNINLSGLSADNDFSGPEGLFFGRASNPTGLASPLLWISTSDGAYTDVTNNQMLAAIPGFRGDGDTDTDSATTAFKNVTNTDSSGTFTVATPVGKPATAALIRRFLVGPVQAAITGVDSTPDGKTLFVNVQHPGQSGGATTPSSNWPASQAGAAAGSRPRSATIVIRRTDGGVVGL